MLGKRNPPVTSSTNAHADLLSGTAQEINVQDFHKRTHRVEMLKVIRQVLQFCYSSLEE